MTIIPMDLANNSFYYRFIEHFIVEVLEIGYSERASVRIY